MSSYVACGETLAEGSRNLSGNRYDAYDDLDFVYDRAALEEYNNDYVTSQRRHKERAAAVFEEDLAELRRKRRDMQDRIFDVIDLNAEIEKARTTLEAADFAFHRHATKFDNEDREDMTITEKLDRSRKIANMDIEKPGKKGQPLQWVKVPEVDLDSCLPQTNRGMQNRKNSYPEVLEIANPMESLAMQPMKRRFLKRKKSVSF